ncbi:TBC1 domain family member 17 isoform X2 [Dasypus novemcinctus]|uniref:TBC1 domain family member 17 isoform X2 n=1 Tax=Dasypus novemcinctus TaxID=9361 RepID=UPI00265EE36E|nr:TBC1 domain family member 17 isoform X2 [Dasypus novemcinctus]
MEAADHRVVFEKGGVYLHTSAKKHQDPDSLIAGVVRVVEKDNDVLLHWAPVEEAGDSTQILFSKKDSNGVDPCTSEEEPTFDPGYEPDWAVISTVRPRPRRSEPTRGAEPSSPRSSWAFSVSLGELKSIRRSKPGLSWAYLVLVTQAGGSLPALHFHRGGTRALLRVLSRYLLLASSPQDSRLYLVFPHNSSALSNSFHHLQLFDQDSSNVVSDPYSTTFSSFSRVTNFFRGALQPHPEGAAPGLPQAPEDEAEPGFEVISCVSTVVVRGPPCHGGFGGSSGAPFGGQGHRKCFQPRRCAASAQWPSSLGARPDPVRPCRGPECPPVCGGQWGAQRGTPWTARGSDPGGPAGSLCLAGGAGPAAGGGAGAPRLGGGVGPPRGPRGPPAAGAGAEGPHLLRGPEPRPEAGGLEVPPGLLQLGGLGGGAQGPRAPENGRVFPHEAAVEVERDVSRTDRTNKFYEGPENPGLGLLSDILLTYCMYHFDLGYVQGMSDLLSPILYVLQNEVDAFWCFCGFMELVHGNFEESQETMKQQLGQLLLLLRVLDPPLCDFLDSQDSGSLCFCFRWLLIWFKREFPFPDILRLWEVLWTGLPGPNLHLLVACAILDMERDALMLSGFGSNEILKHINELTMKLSVEDVLTRAEALYRQLTACAELPLNVQEVLGLAPPAEPHSPSPPASPLPLSPTRAPPAPPPAGAPAPQPDSSLEILPEDDDDEGGAGS